MSIEPEKIIELIPEIISKRPDLKLKLVQIMSENFVTREDMLAVLQEMRAQREEWSRRFDTVDREMRAQREEWSRRFEAVDRELVAQREDWSKRFEAVDKRFEAVDKRFEVVDKRFEAVDKRFEAVDRRFEAVDRRFEAVDRRFEALIAEIKEIKVQMATKQEMQDQRKWMEIVVGGFQRRAGRGLEDTIAGALRVGLEMKNITADGIKLRQKLVDEDGELGFKGRMYEFDMLVTDGESYVFEVKSQADEEDVLHFNDKADFAIRKLALKNAKKVILTLDKPKALIENCERCGILLA